MIFGEIAEMIRYRGLLRNLVSRDIKVRYKRSVFGFLWVMLNPLLIMLILNIVFSEVFRVSTKNYSAYLLSGLVLWNFFSQSTQAALTSFIGNGGLIKKLYLPKSIFPLSVILSAMVHLAFSVIPLFAIFLFTDVQLSPYLYLLPYVVAVVALFSYGISLIICTLTVFFHDMRYIYEVLLTALMYLTPIFYPESIVPQKYIYILQLNPVNYYLGLFRATTYADNALLTSNLMYATLFAVLTFLLGWFIYEKYKDRIVYNL